MKQVAKYALVGAVVGAFSLLGATQSQAQACIGFPNTAGQVAVGVTSSFPTGGNTFGAEAGYNFAGPLAAFVGFGIFSPDAEGASDITSLGGGVAFDLPALAAVLPAGLQTCPTASFVFDDLDQTDAYSIPIGVGFGTSLGIGDGLAFNPYVIPQLNLYRSPDSNSSDFLLELGGLVTIGNTFYAGATVNRFFVENAESVFGIKLGARF
jgi:hypothetical protein